MLREMAVLKSTFNGRKNQQKTFTEFEPSQFCLINFIAIIPILIHIIAIKMLFVYKQNWLTKVKYCSFVVCMMEEEEGKEGRRRKKVDNFNSIVDKKYTVALFFPTFLMSFGFVIFV